MVIEVLIQLSRHLVEFNLLGRGQQPPNVALRRVSHFFNFGTRLREDLIERLAVFCQNGIHLSFLFRRKIQFAHQTVAHVKRMAAVHEMPAEPHHRDAGGRPDKPAHTQKDQNVFAFSVHGLVDGGGEFGNGF